MPQAQSRSAAHDRQDLDQTLGAKGRHSGRPIAPQETAASERRRELPRAYTRGLRRYLSGPEDLALEHAHELGRQALTDGLGVLEMAMIHSQATAAVLNRPVAADERARVFESLERFFVEALAPFEMAHRGFWEANAQLRRVNDVLEGQAKRIAFALHDEAAQLLASVHLALADIATRLPPENAQELQAARGLLDQIEHRLRNLAHELRPPILDDLGLVPALEFLAESVSKRWGFHVTVEASIDRHLPPIVETTLYRVTQEALTNVAKHAKATHAHVSVRRAVHKIVCSICDDGIGLDTTARGSDPQRRGLGLVEIQERAAALGGRLHLLGGNGTPGTNLTIEIPLER
jgi:two-component system sensor histidine kinase UhpB